MLLLKRGISCLNGVVFVFKQEKPGLVHNALFEVWLKDIQLMVSVWRSEVWFELRIYNKLYDHNTSSQCVVKEYALKTSSKYTILPLKANFRSNVFLKW